MRVRDIMTTNVITASVNDCMRDVALMLREKKITGVPVLDEDGNVVGVFSETDILSRLPDILMEAEKIPLVDVKELTDHKIKEVMSSPVITVSPDADIKEVAEIFLYKYIHRVPVVENGKLVGIVSLGDLLKAFLSK
ncbi:MAG: CBS domain-containing protein [Deferribacterales bacterium]